MALKLLVKTPKTINGVTLLYDADKKVVYRENIMELAAEAGLRELNAKLPEHLRHEITKVEVKEVGVANSKINELKKRLAELEAEKEDKELLAKIAELEGKGDAGNGDAKKPAQVKELVALIEAAETVEQVNEIAGTDERKGVLDAKTKKIAELEGKGE